MAFAYAGQYGPETILDQTSKEVANTPVTVYQSNGSTLATLYTDETMAASAANPATTDTLGNLVFFATPGRYVLSFTIAGVATTRTVIVNPWHLDLLPAITEVDLALVTGPRNLKMGRTSITYVTGGYNLIYASAFPGATDAVLVTPEIGEAGYAIAGISSQSFIVKLYLAGVEVANGTSIAIGWLAVGH